MAITCPAVVGVVRSDRNKRKQKLKVGYSGAHAQLLHGTPFCWTLFPAHVQKDARGRLSLAFQKKRAPREDSFYRRTSSASARVNIYTHSFELCLTDCDEWKRTRVQRPDNRCTYDVAPKARRRGVPHLSVRVASSDKPSKCSEYLVTLGFSMCIRVRSFDCALT